MIGALWDYGRFDQSKWDTLVVSGAISEAPDTPEGLVQVIHAVSGSITEDRDDVFGVVVRVIDVSGAGTDGPDLVAGFVGVRGAVYGDITEGPDVVYGRVQVKYAYRGSWAPQFSYKREWEKEPELEIEPEYVEPEIELDPDFVPMAPPMDPAVARIIEMMRQGPQIIDTDEEDISALLMGM
jgi:hypothetical protein